MPVAAKNVAQLPVALVLSAFLATNVMGLAFHAPGMPMNERGEMAGCIFVTQAAICQMNVLEHLNLWQNLFTAIPQKAATVLLMILTLAAIIFSRARRRLRLFNARLAQSQRFHLFHQTAIRALDYLHEAFSQGILHPKIY